MFEVSPGACTNYTRDLHTAYNGKCHVKDCQMGKCWLMLSRGSSRLWVVGPSAIAADRSIWLAFLQVVPNVVLENTTIKWSIESHIFNFEEIIQQIHMMWRTILMLAAVWSLSLKRVSIVTMSLEAHGSTRAGCKMVVNGRNCHWSKWNGRGPSFTSF